LTAVFKVPADSPGLIASSTPAGPARAPAPWDIFIPMPGKTVFDDLGQLPVRVHRALPRGDVGRAAVVLPFPHSADATLLQQAFARLETDWTPALRAAAERGDIGLVADASAEGVEHTGAFTKALYRGLHALGVPSHKASVVTQERNFGEDYARYCSRKGYDGRISVLYYDFWIRRFLSQFETKSPRRLARRVRTFEARTDHRSKAFVSLNLSIRASKLVFLLSLLRDDLWDRGHISFGGFRRRFSERDAQLGDHSSSYVAERLKRLKGFEDLGQELAPLIPRLEQIGPILFGDVAEGDGNGPGQKAPLSPLDREYDDSWFSVITESEMRSRPSRVTEKPFKSLVSFHPLIVLGNPGALRALREFGFETFPEMIDERYDEEDDPRRRFDMAYAEVQRLCAMDEDELAKMERRLRDKLMFNAEWAIVHMPRRYRQELDAALTQRIFGLGEGKPGA